MESTMQKQHLTQVKRCLNLLKINYLLSIMNKRAALYMSLFVLISPICAQNSPEELFAVFSEQEITTDTNGSFVFSTDYSNSGSHWEVDWSETHVFLNMMKYTHPTNINKSFELRLGKGAQVYSFKSSFGEAIPPQWRQKYDDNGNVVSELTPSVVNGKILSEKGNWAPWVDEVWQMVNSDQNDMITENGVEEVQNRNMHQAGSYLNNNAHRSSDHTEKPFYSPVVASNYDSEKQEFTSINWVQSEDPSYLYDGRSDCNPCHPDIFKPATLFYTKYKNLGDGIIQVDFLMTNHHQTRETRFFNVPFIGIRKSSLAYSFLSNPDNTYSAISLTDWGNAVTVRNTETNGWFAVSNHPTGNGASLAFVFPINVEGYSDFRYGAALGPNEIRDTHIFSNRLLSAGTNYWNLEDAKSTRGRYFILMDANVQSIATKIQSKGLVNAAKTERIDFSEDDSLTINYTISTQNGGFVATESTQQESNFILKQTPFLNSFPVFLIHATNGDSRLSSDPYFFSLRPYDDQLKSIQLLGYSNTKVDRDPASLSLNNFYKKKVKLYPNPSSSSLFLETDRINIRKEIKIYNQIGQLMDVTIIGDENQRKIEIDISSLAKGVYYISIDGDRKVIVKN
jgi:hypothetical protein